MSDEVKLEEEWVAAKQAKQEAARRPPPKSRKGLVIGLVTLLVAAGLITVVFYAGSSEPHASSASADRIKIEIRAMPTADIKVNGRKLGKTPISMTFAKSDKEITIEAEFIRELVRRGGRKAERWQDVRKVKLDRDQLIDVTTKTAKMIESEESRPGMEP